MKEHFSLLSPIPWWWCWGLNIENLYTTVGVHPTRCTEFDNWEKGPEDYMQQLISIVEQDTSHRIVAVGEFGLGNTKNSHLQNLLFFTATVFLFFLVFSRAEALCEWEFIAFLLY